MPPTINAREQTGSASERRFAGFALPTSNTTYCPNQFFDVCLPHYPRGVVRLVAYLIRKTLGWSDADGKPQAERHAVTYAELAARAGVSRDMIRSAIDGAVNGHFIRCVRQPRSRRLGSSSVTGVYELKWDDAAGHADTEYVKDPKRFRGFFAGEGNRTYIPNQFFDALVPAESLAVLKVVGSVMRFSIGFQNKWGHRRRNVALSYQLIQNYTRLRDRKSLGAAVRRALDAGYIERVADGYFDPDGGRLSRAAVYALKWLNSVPTETVGRKTPPADTHLTGRSDTPAGIGRKTPPAGRSENPTGIQITGKNNTVKQQDPLTAAASERLSAEGFDAAATSLIVSRFPASRIHRQIDWINRRNARANRLGLLRTSIEQDWGEPAAVGPQLGAPNWRRPRPSGTTFGEAIDQARRRLLGDSTNTPNS